MLKMPNPSKEHVTLTLYMVGGTPRAYLFSTLPKDVSGGRQRWVCKRYIIHKECKEARVNQWLECQVTLSAKVALMKGFICECMNPIYTTGRSPHVKCDRCKALEDRRTPTIEDHKYFRLYRYLGTENLDNYI